MKKVFISIQKKLNRSTLYVIIGGLVIILASFISIAKISDLYKRNLAYYRQKECAQSLQALFNESVADIQLILYQGKNELVPIVLARNEETLYLHSEYAAISNKLGLVEDLSFAEELGPIILKTKVDFYTCLALIRENKVVEAKDYFNRVLYFNIKHIRDIVEKIVYQSQLNTEKNDRKIKSQTTRILFFDIAFFLLLIGSISFLNIKTGRGISVPAGKLTAVIKEIMKTGNLNPEIDVVTNDEIGQLASSFIEMIKKLKDTESQLIQSAKMVSVGLLAGGVAHEINNPLTGVLNNVQLIKMILEQQGKQMSPADFKDLLDAIERSAQRCKKITQSLLDFSRASKSSFRQLSLNSIVEEVASLIEYELSLQNITIKKELEPGLPAILGDNQLLQQIIFDVVSNANWAIKKRAGKEAGIITIKTKYDLRERVCCVFISDNGIGIAKEELNRIFEPFFTTKEVGEGTGLGLSIVYNIIKAHKGRIEVESEVGKGTAFKISLPVSAEGGS